MMGLSLILTCLTILTFTCSIVTASDENDAHSFDYGTVMQIVEKLDKRVAALEVENEQQRSQNEQQRLENEQQRLENEQQRLEISDLRGLLQNRHAHEDKERGGEKAVHDEDSGIDKKNRIQRANPEMPIGFFASLSATLSHLGHGQNIRFEKVVTNVGNAYDSSVGIFRAPFAGVYVFSTTVLTANRDTTHYGFALNGKQFTYMFVNGVENAFDDASQTVVLQLSPGDDVSVQHIDSDKSLSGNNHCLFSGFLLSQNIEGASIVG